MAAWLCNLFPPPHAAELRGLTMKECERLLRDLHGYSQKRAKEYVWRYKRRLGLARFRDEHGVAVR